MSQFIADNLETVEGLGEQDVRLWIGRVGVDDLPEITLPAEVDARAARRVNAADGARFRAMHRHVRWVLASWLGCDVDALELGRTQTGQPVVASGQSVSWAHSEDAIAIAMCEAGPVGVDLQVHGERDWAAMLPMVAAQEERAAIGSSEDAFYRLWCLKEAIAKADGRGLDETLRHIRLDEGLIDGGTDDGPAWLGGRAFACRVRRIDLAGSAATLALAAEGAETG